MMVSHVVYDDKSKEINAEMIKGFRDLEAVISNICPKGNRYVSLALTNLEQASLWAGKAIAAAQVERGA